MRRRRTRSGDAITLFPFLAVLICTMGSLIVLLVVMVQQAKASAVDRTRERTERRQSAAAEAAAIKAQVEDLSWRVEVLRLSRSQTEEDLKTRETELSYLEDEIRQARTKLERAAAEAAQIEQLASEESGDRQAAEAARKRLREELDYALERLAQTRRQFEQGERSYALVPYRGRNGTRRRPIYIECTSDRVILQPEGIELFNEDFQEPLTDDNALASALRAQREYFADATGNRHDPPYPLIVVRPDGAHAYAAARAAMESWDSEFGYELVEHEMKLSFPDVDAALVDVIREAVEEARARRKMLQNIAPARFGRRSQLLTASRSGGFVPSASGPGDDDPTGRSPFGRETPPVPHGRPGAYGGDDAARLPNGGPISLGGPMSRRTGVGSDGPAALGTGPGDLRGPRGESIDPANGYRDGMPREIGAGGGDPMSHTETTETGNGQAFSGQVGRGGVGSANDGVDTREGTSATAGPTSSSSPSASDGSLASASSAGMSGAGHAGTSGAQSGAAGAATRQLAVGGQGQAGAGSMSPSGFSADATSLARSRGADWGLPERAQGATGITRPIHIQCFPDKLVILPENRGGGTPAIIDLEGPIRGQVDDFVSRIWSRLDTWGIAGHRMYWKPILQVQVQPGAEARYAELAQLLEDSGMIVKRK